MLFEHHHLQLGFYQKLPLLQRYLRQKPVVPLLELGQPPGLLGLNHRVVLPTAVIRRLGHLDHGGLACG